MNPGINPLKVYFVSVVVVICAGSPSDSNFNRYMVDPSEEFHAKERNVLVLATFHRGAFCMIELLMWNCMNQGNQDKCELYKKCLGRVRRARKTCYWSPIRGPPGRPAPTNSSMQLTQDPCVSNGTLSYRTSQIDN